MFKKYRAKLLALVLSWKFHLLVLSTWLFIRGTLSESGWLIMAASTTGLRELMSLMTLKLSPQQDNRWGDFYHTGKVDDPDA